MDFYYVTGSSRGIGRALAERILADPDTYVVGIARGDGISNSRYTHLKLDLTRLEDVQSMQFDRHDGAERAILVNNAALMSVGQVGGIDPYEFIAIHQANAIAPALLMNAFVSACRGSNLKQAVVCTVTSRAGSVPVPGAAAYCSAKAALEMTTRVAALEAERSGDTMMRFLIANPGEVDTDMQSLLYGSHADDLPGVAIVRRRKDEGKLVSPKIVAERLYQILRDPDLVSTISFDVQELQPDLGG